MPLLDEIIELASNDKEPIGNVLRKCLVLESQSANEAFKIWLDKELDGYDHDDELPSYRRFRAISYGFFVGSFGRSINDQPLALHVLEEQDRKRLEICSLPQPASAYEGRKDKTREAQLPWNPSLTTKYQTKFFTDDDLVLNRAWQVIPGSVLTGLLETVRNRVLRFALELKKLIGEQNVSSISAETINDSVERHIFAGKKFDWT
jgi:hypothetical protein